jgi:hypothetical protein
MKFLFDYASVVFLRAVSNLRPSDSRPFVCIRGYLLCFLRLFSIVAAVRLGFA